jgi:N-acyl-D-aspartate/D-glutamate deacylase
MEAEVRNGYMALHAQPEYAPGVSQLELLDVGRIAAKLDVPLCVHARYSDNLAPGLQSEATAELVTVARETGAHVHVEHLNSTGGTGRMAEALEEIQSARDEGLRITACMYPYEFWATTLKSARFRDWQEKFGLTYQDLQVAGTSERLTEATFRQAYDQNLLTAAFAIPPGDIDLGFERDFMIIGSDAILEADHNNHPRSTGCFSRVLGYYSRERNIVSLPNALAMMTIRPANLAALGAPDVARKGRMQIGADADVTVFNPATIEDQSTIADPAQEAFGVTHVFVLGQAVRTNGVNTSARPGTALRSAIV